MNYILWEMKETNLRLAWYRSDMGFHPIIDKNLLKSAHFMTSILTPFGSLFLTGHHKPVSPLRESVNFQHHEPFQRSISRSKLELRWLHRSLPRGTPGISHPSHSQSISHNRDGDYTKEKENVTSIIDLFPPKLKLNKIPITLYS
jgi:hypothetical protein